MMRSVVGLAGAVAAGAWLGVSAEWISSSGGWDEMDLGASAVRALLFFVAAFAVCQSADWHLRAGWWFVVPATCLLGGGLFGSIAYMDDTTSWLDIEPGRVIMFAVESLPVMAGTVAIGSGIIRGGRWLVSTDMPGGPSRSMVDR